MDFLFEKFISFLAGILVKYFVKGNFWDTQLVKNWRARKTERLLHETLSRAKDDLTFAQFRIKQITATLFPTPLTIDDVPCYYTASARQINQDLLPLEHDLLPKKVARLTDLRRTVDFNDLYGLSEISFIRPQKNGSRTNAPKLTFEPTNFRFYLMINDSLDEPIYPGRRSIRDQLRLRLSDFHWSMIREFPFHLWFATVTAVLTKDDQIVIPIRSRTQAIQDKAIPNTWPVSMSCVEGMLRPKDSSTGTPDGIPSPFYTVRRALKDELGLESGTHFRLSDIRLLALAFDKRRCQPVGVFFVYLPDTTFMDVYECWQHAADRIENQTIYPMAKTPDAFARLLCGKQTYQGKPLILFSNHQELGALLTAFHLFGVSSFRRVLSSIMQS